MGLGRTVALFAIMTGALVHGSSAATASDDRAHLHFDGLSNCGVFDAERTAAVRATWSGECVQGFASGRGTAVFTRLNHTRETISATFLGGRVQDGPASIQWSDGARFEGAISSGKPNGAGVLTRANGDRFDGVWKQGSLDGRGSVVWANGDRYDGDFVRGRAEGHGVQIWANGDRYDGAWHNDLPDGAGTVTRKGGEPIAARFVEGKRQVTAPTHATPTLAAAHAKPAPATFFLSALAGTTLSGLDGSSIKIESADGGVLRTFAGADGHTDKTIFKMLNDNLGTVSAAADSTRAIGLFRTTASSLAAEYSDGRVEHLTLTAGGGLAALFKSASGQMACVSWYPEGHVFSVDERKAAVSAYAERLGVSLPATTKAIQRCAPQMHVATVGRPEAKLVHSAFRPATTPTLPPYRLGDGPANLQSIPVRESIVHPIDPPDAPVTPANATRAPANEAVVSNCLKVDSDGSYWGFRNHCDFSVQFAYCLLRDTAEAATCGENGAGTASGSAAASGFSALFADKTLSGGPAEHDFRWVACRGGAGEVVARLDVAEPASGRCLQRSSAQQQQQASN